MHMHKYILGNMNLSLVSNLLYTEDKKIHELIQNRLGNGVKPSERFQ